MTTRVSRAVSASGIHGGLFQMERLIEIKQTELNPTLRALSDAGGLVDDAAWIRQGDNVSLVIRFIHEKRELANKNSFKQTVAEQIAALRKQNEAGDWGISEETFTRLLETVPAWPKGKDAYRSFRIRFGEGDEGVALTFERHAEAMERVHANFLRWNLLHSKPMPYKGEEVKRLRLLGGNESHHAVVEWIIIPDLSAHRQRKSITNVRDAKSFADEGLVLAWLNTKRVQAIDYKKWPAWFCAGYESNVPECGVGPWQGVVVVGRNLGGGAVDLDAGWRSNANSYYSVPSVGE